MSVASSNPSEMAAPSTFSYAQAAKGQSAAPSNTNTNSATQEPVKPVASEVDQTTSSNTPATTENPDIKPTISDKLDMDSVPGSDYDSKSESIQERRSESRRDDDSGRLDRPWRRNDKGTRSSSTTTRSADEQDARKIRRGKKGKTSEKQAGDQGTEKEQESQPEPPKVELSEAPIPSVNIWHKRKEAQLAKGKSPTTEMAVNGAAGQPEEIKPLTKTTEEPASAGSREVPYTNGVKPQRKGPDAPRQERNGPRGSRVVEKDGKAEVPPSVEDAFSWPTPETAVKEDKRKGTDRSDRSDKDAQEDGAQPRSRQKWVTYDYVPSVSFETQLPQMRNSKPRGGARAARDNGTRAAAVADKPASATTANKPNGSNERSREPTSSTRATSQPPSGKRASLDGSNSREQKKASAGSDKGKDTGSQTAEIVSAPRERTDGRSERGRGGYRGRGAHHSVNSQAQHQNSPSIVGTQGFGGPNGASRTGPYSPPLRQGGHGQGFIPQNQRGRGGRGGANFHRMSLPNGTTRMPPVQTQFTSYEYPMAPMSAVPYASPPFWDGMLVSMLKAQIEYYFSVENLCKDMYLRARMDSQGFVPLHFIAAFKRMRDLSPDLALIRSVCEESTEVDYIVGEDDCERLRSRAHWQSFVLPMKDRDELARNAGPSQLTFKNRSYTYGHQFNGMAPMAYPPAYPTNVADPSFQPYMEGVAPEQSPVNMVNGNGPSQLSAAVPDFSPSGAVPAFEFDASKKGLNPEAASVTPELSNGQSEAALTNGLTNGVHE